MQNIEALSLGKTESCALLVNGHVQCWGLLASNITSLENVVQLTSGTRHHCALLEDQSVRGWGQNDYGQLGDGTDVD
ncbi:MAG: hypothetical protein GY822_29860 [Deltaproteobacteria bacterium]|nr:hypothetical protein [Deltaproteobacteria bacterium]